MRSKQIGLILVIISAIITTNTTYGLIDLNDNDDRNKTAVGDQRTLVLPEHVPQHTSVLGEQQDTAIESIESDDD